MTLQAVERRDVSERKSVKPERGHAQARTQLVAAIGMAMVRHGMNQVQAARELGTDQPTLSKVLRGRIASVSIEKMLNWLIVLGYSVEIRVTGPVESTKAQLTTVVNGGSDA